MSYIGFKYCFCPPGTIFFIQPLDDAEHCEFSHSDFPSPLISLCLWFPPSPYVVKYYGSYFKNTDLWIVMEYCGAGSVSDIIRLRNKTVGAYTKWQNNMERCRKEHSKVIWFRKLYSLPSFLLFDSHISWQKMRLPLSWSRHWRA